MSESAVSFEFGRFGLKGDPIGAHVVWDVRDRHYLAQVWGVERDEVRGVTMLRVRHLDGSPIEGFPMVAASGVKVLVRR